MKYTTCEDVGWVCEAAYPVNPCWMSEFGLLNIICEHRQVLSQTVKDIPLFRIRHSAASDRGFSRRVS